MASSQSNTNSDLEANRAEGIPEPPKSHHAYRHDKNEISERHILNQIQEMDGNRVKGVVILSFRGLLLYRIAKLQSELLEKHRIIFRHIPGKPCGTASDQADGNEVDELLQRYTDAVRNYETLSQTIQFHENPSYEFLGRVQGIRIHERRHDVQSNQSLSWLFEPKTTFSVGSWQRTPLGFRELDKGNESQRFILEGIWSRLHMAVIGGVSLIAPVVYMTLRPSRVGNLVAASISTAVFAIILVIFAVDASGKDVLASTAAYAAVMVVFIGSSS
ncbi:hypothetical protein F4805DRAFT_471513 [Annulohypoxylon moriforme]|nr:hypothetical protein F4805DRAFT_471513 [Annulohypoxylon moriforme]